MPAIKVEQKEENKKKRLLPLVPRSNLEPAGCPPILKRSAPIIQLPESTINELLLEGTFQVPLKKVAENTETSIDFISNLPNTCRFSVSLDNFLFAPLQAVVTVKQSLRRPLIEDMTLKLSGVIDETFQIRKKWNVQPFLENLKEQFLLLAKFSEHFTAFMSWSNEITVKLCPCVSPDHNFVIDVTLRDRPSFGFRVLCSVVTKELTMPLILINQFDLTIHHQKYRQTKKKLYELKTSEAIQDWFKMLRVNLEAFLQPDKSFLNLLQDCLQRKAFPQRATNKSQCQIRSALKTVTTEMRLRGCYITASTEGSIDTFRAIYGDFRFSIFFKTWSKSIAWRIELVDPSTSKYEESDKFQTVLDPENLLVNYHSCLELFFLEAKKRMARSYIVIPVIEVVVEEEESKEPTQMNIEVKVEIKEEPLEDNFEAAQSKESLVLDGESSLEMKEEENFDPRLADLKDEPDL